MRGKCEILKLLGWCVGPVFVCVFVSAQTQRTCSGSSASPNADSVRLGGIGGAELQRRWQMGSVDPR